MKEQERVRWRCRRGMLELDIVLQRFVDRSYAQLDDAEKHAFDVLLDMPDTELWDMIAGKRQSEAAEQQAVLEQLRQA
jgi:antitoxin CptB